MSKIFLDTEFIEDGKTIELLSIGLVAENGAEFYAVNMDADHSKANDWVKQNVLPHLRPPGMLTYNLKRDRIGEEIIGWLERIQVVKPKFWGYYADYDWVAFCQLFGTMMQLPKGFPMYCNDLKQLCVMYGDPELPKQATTEHNALYDARWNRDTYRFLESLSGYTLPK